MIRLDATKLTPFLHDHELTMIEPQAELAREILTTGRGAGSDFLGWIDLPEKYDREEFDRIKKAAEKIKSDSEVLLVIGIGGSYLGARAAIEFLRHSFYNMLDKSRLNAHFTHFCAGGLLISVPISILFLIMQKYYVEGITSGSNKE